MSNVNIHIKFQSRDAVSLGGRKELCFRYLVVVDQSLSHIWLFVTSWTAALQVSLPFTISLSLLKLCQWCHPTISSSVVPFSSCLQSFPASGSFQWVSSSHQVANYWHFNISPFNEYSGFISFRIDWFDLLVVQGNPKSPLQHRSSKASILWRSAFFTVQLSHPYVTTGKTISLTRWTFVGKVMSLPFNMPSRLVKTFLPGSKHLLISWLQSPSEWFWSPQK